MFRLHRIARIEKRLPKIKMGARLLGFRGGGLLQNGQGVGGPLVAKEQDSEVQIRLIETGLKFERTAEFRNRFGVLVLKAERKGQVEMRGIILPVGGNGFAQQRLGCGGLVGRKSLFGVFKVARGGREEEEEEESAGCGRHFFSLTVSPFSLRFRGCNTIVVNRMLRFGFDQVRPVHWVNQLHPWSLKRPDKPWP